MSKDQKKTDQSKKRKGEANVINLNLRQQNEKVLELMEQLDSFCDEQVYFRYRPEESLLLARTKNSIHDIHIDIDDILPELTTAAGIQNIAAQLSEELDAHEESAFDFVKRFHYELFDRLHQDLIKIFAELDANLDISKNLYIDGMSLTVAVYDGDLDLTYQVLEILFDEQQGTFYSNVKMEVMEGHALSTRVEYEGLGDILAMVDRGEGLTLEIEDEIQFLLNEGRGLTEEQVREIMEIVDTYKIADIDGRLTVKRDVTDQMYHINIHHTALHDHIKTEHGGNPDSGIILSDECDCIVFAEKEICIEFITSIIQTIEEIEAEAHTN